MANRVALALGSNLGNRLANLQKARDMLRKLSPEGSTYLQAPIYQSEPVLCPDDSPDFLNTVIEINYIGTPHELLKQTQSIELHFGRDAIHELNAPRVIDIDILYFGNESLDEGNLILPHPRLTERRFVLHPLADICPDHVLPNDSTTIAEHLKHLDSDEPPLSLVQANW